MRTEWKFEPRLCELGCGCPRWHLNCIPVACPRITHLGRDKTMLKTKPAETCQLQQFEEKMNLICALTEEDQWLTAETISQHYRHLNGFSLHILIGAFRLNKLCSIGAKTMESRSAADKSRTFNVNFKQVIMQSIKIVRLSYHLVRSYKYFFTDCTMWIAHVKRKKKKFRKVGE